MKALLPLVLLAACMPASHRQAKRLEGRYDVGDPGEGWAPVASGGADRAWVHDRFGASLYTDSNCGPRFTGARTEDLATELQAGLHDGSLLFEEKLALGGREGVMRAWSGTLDGIPVHVGAAVVNKDRCTYDFVIVAPPPRFDEAWPAFEAVLDGFATR